MYQSNAIRKVFIKMTITIVKSNILCSVILIEVSRIHPYPLASRIFLGLML